MRRVSRLAALGTLLGALLLASSVRLAAAPAAATTLYLPVLGAPACTVTLTQIGEPTWRLVDLHLFTAPVGTVDDGYAAFFETANAILPPPNHGPGATPGAPHPPPYDRELAQGIRALALSECGPFPASGFTAGHGVYIAWMTVPNPGVVGSSPDSPAGAIIPNTLFPMRYTGSSTRNGALYDAALTDMEVPGLTGWDGTSHNPSFVADNTDFRPPGAPIEPEGSYLYRIRQVDSSGAGWEIEASFIVGDQP